MYERDEAYPAGRMAFIATLPGDKAEQPKEPPETAQWTARFGKAANVTPDGDVLLFTSHGDLTGAHGSFAADEQVYWYDAVSGRLARVSVGEHGFDDDGVAGVGGARIVLPLSRVGQPREDPSMSDDGSVVFFQSPVGLTARALDDVPVNDAGENRDLAQNIYEWEQPGTHGCSEEAGCIYLVSDGQDASENGGGGGGATYSSVELLGTDATGDDVFFTTADRLVPGDTDSALDIYDARVDGGFPAPAAPVECVGEECHGQGPVASVFGVLPSETLAGGGNLPSGGAQPSPPPRVVKPATRAEMLAKALKACRRKHGKHARRACEASAKHRYAKKHPKGRKK